MKFISIKNDKVPALGFGTYKLYGDECVSAVDFAIQNGYTHIDTAQIYENESAVGEGIARSGIPREKIFLTTKVWRNHFSADETAKSVDESLRKLKTDYVDLLLIHWPFPETPLTKMVEDLVKLREKGKARHIGVSNFTVAQMQEAMKTAPDIFCNQVEYHPYLSQKPVLDFIQRNGFALTAYSPIARGKVFNEPVLKEIGDKYGKNEAQITLRWLIQQDNVAAIPKSGTPENIKNNIDIFDFELTSDEMHKIHSLSRKETRLIDLDGTQKWDKAA